MIKFFKVSLFDGDECHYFAYDEEKAKLPTIAEITNFYNYDATEKIVIVELSSSEFYEEVCALFHYYILHLPSELPYFNDSARTHDHLWEWYEPISEN